MKRNTYWMHDRRGFANEYTVAIATTKEAAQFFEDNGYYRITRKQANRDARYDGDAATESFVGLRVDSDSVLLADFLDAMNGRDHRAGFARRTADALFRFNQ